MKNVSKLFGVPANKDAGVKQHKMLRDKLKHNDVWSIPSMHRGYLVLKHQMSPVRKNSTYKVDIYPNYLQKAKPSGEYIMVSKV